MFDFKQQQISNSLQLNSNLRWLFATLKLIMSYQLFGRLESIANPAKWCKKMLLPINRDFPVAWAFFPYFYIVFQVKKSLWHIAPIWKRCLLTRFSDSTFLPWAALTAGLWSSGKLWFLWYFTNYTSYDTPGSMKRDHCFYFKFIIFLRIAINLKYWVVCICINVVNCICACTYRQQQQLQQLTQEIIVE